MNISYNLSVSAPYIFTISSGLITLPLDLDIFSPPSAKMSPWEVRFIYGSLVGTSFKSKRNLCQKREYKRWRVVCSLPPLYQSTPPVPPPPCFGEPSQYFRFFLSANALE